MGKLSEIKILEYMEGERAENEEGIMRGRSGEEGVR